LTAARPGQTLGGVSGYGQFCPVALGAEVLASRWTPLIVRELLNGSIRFSELQRGLPRISRNLLVQRLATLEQAGVVETRPRAAGRGREYRLTAAGEDLRPVVEALGTWGYKWASHTLTPDCLDPGLLLWFIRRRIHTEHLPPRRQVVRFDFQDAPRRLYWLVIDRPEIDVCAIDPGFDVDVRVEATLVALTEVYLGRTTMRDALHSGQVRVAGPRAVCDAFPRWFGLSPFAPAAVAA
jgi:DNA-binding HxlR family transcriptional regulator